MPKLTGHEVGVARQGLGRYLTFYDQQRPHKAFDGKMPDKCTAKT
jgi:hypothetical protein